ncbi:MAG: hypothetical protein A2096_08610 [Spirochaetes bacterium GWF1_41_5]|nr:MAG: hypothetical protein A2096_08610 [Spirochaetes bacterium GWF1_41_5]HBE04476.1 hypothetical protein [Spirochaetia bacterium]
MTILRNILFIVIIPVIVSPAELALRSQAVSGKAVSLPALFTSADTWIPEIVIPIPLHDEFTVLTRAQVIFYCRKVFPLIDAMQISGEQILLFKNRQYSPEENPVTGLDKKTSGMPSFAYEKVSAEENAGKIFKIREKDISGEIIKKNAEIIISIEQNDLSIITKGILLHDTPMNKPLLIGTAGSAGPLMEYLDSGTVEILP